VLLVVEEARGVVSRPNTRSSTEVAKLQVFDRRLEKILEFIIACRLFIRMRIRKKHSRETNTVDFIIYTRKFSRCVKGKYFGRSKNRSIGV